MLCMCKGRRSWNIYISLGKKLNKIVVSVSEHLAPFGLHDPGEVVTIYNYNELYYKSIQYSYYRLYHSQTIALVMYI